MARQRRRWRKRAGKAMRAALRAAVILGALCGLIVALGTGNFLLALLLMPAMAAGAVLALPFMVLGLVMAVAAVALPVGIVAAMFGGPLYVVHRLTRRRADDDDADEDETLPAALGPEARLRRRYVAGELTYAQFRDGMLEALKGRFTRGELSVTQYERELQQLIEPARVVDTRDDPAVAGALARGG